MEENKQVEVNLPEHKSPVTTVGMLRKLVKKMEHLDDDTEISSDLILTACFPSMFENMMDYANNCYAQGYITGYKEGKGIEDED